MDEVEPALDDVNLHRFLRLVEGFAADSQVLIVTHQKRTMEVAGMMYGVSLTADGTTKVVCQRLEGSLEKARDAARKEAEREEAAAAAARGGFDGAAQAVRLPSTDGDGSGARVPQDEPVG